ncbi:hypothetical protein L6452_24047 [Arctium lappa]|uniref:Uncharacterized protein n=1 Tax=Arctium lappa TaxID=4217 RepID=A0ACB9A944_ARCLA|nr:hypothetical protein L6452_24047 [Arctium lappa]
MNKTDLSDFSILFFTFFLPDEELGTLLILPDFSQGDGSRPESVWFLHTSGGRCRLPGSLGGELLPWSLSSGGFPGGLLSTSHLVENVFGEERYRNANAGRLLMDEL